MGRSQGLAAKGQRVSRRDFCRSGLISAVSDGNAVSPGAADQG